MSYLKILLISLLFAGCKDDTGISVGDNEILVEYQQTVTKEIDGEEWTVAFESIKENSLCPPDATCVWLGRIVVSLSINDEGVVLGYGDLSTDTEERALQNQVIIDGTTISFSEAIDYIENNTTKIVLVFE
ncbi:hypothetical protein SAMN05421640_0110 [Ekhidna lutea]|uniref:Uncharacterized protein n=1 Tax=Ekhidna lutea TaxID=447679 RepID=A0A239EEV5_EKHLU|nr:hypothetical protein [Ekhidna lutea]SNS43137.1 hypothetical protein SAMN05421640_0110 [Ekhidna lutea]